VKSSAKVANPASATSRITRSLVKRSVSSRLRLPPAPADLSATIRQIDDALGRIEALLSRHRAG